MKTKKLPKSVKYFLLLFGFYMGICVGVGTILVVTWFLGLVLGILCCIIEFLVCLAVCFFIAWRWGDTLEEYGVLKKERKKP